MSSNTHPYIHAAPPATLLLVCLSFGACGGSVANKMASNSTAKTTVRASSLRAAGRQRPAARERLVQFATCLRRSGGDVHIVKATHARSAIDATGIDTSRAQFRDAWVRCRESVNLGGKFERRGATRERPGSRAL
jgi:hypothetical protein